MNFQDQRDAELGLILLYESATQSTQQLEQIANYMNTSRTTTTRKTCTEYSKNPRVRTQNFWVQAEWVLKFWGSFSEVRLIRFLGQVLICRSCHSDTIQRTTVICILNSKNAKPCFLNNNKLSIIGYHIYSCI